MADVVIEHPCHGRSGPSMPAAVEAATGDWVLALGADERLSDFAKANLRTWIRASDVDFYRLRERSMVNGELREDELHNRLWCRGKSEVGTQLHQDNQPAAGARVRIINAQVAIEHQKTAAEQAADDRRYRTLLTP